MSMAAKVGMALAIDIVTYQLGAPSHECIGERVCFPYNCAH
jgi:hypothetical protein